MVMKQLKKNSLKSGRYRLIQTRFILIDSEILKKYENNDHFFFHKEIDLAKVCNAPKKGSGVYVVYELKDGRISLVYIGACGKMKSDGNINYLEGNMYHDLVNGRQFGGKRKESWKKKVSDENIDAFDIYWFETFNDQHKDIPSAVVALVLQLHYDVYGELPRWNEEF